MTNHEFVPAAFWADDQGRLINAHGGGVLHHEGVYYWFGEHKIEGEAGNLSHVGVHVYSSEDLYHWQDRGVALANSPDAGSEITKGCVLERPKVIFNRATGKFVMWFHLERLRPGTKPYSDARSGVAVADTPVGPYRYLHSLRPNPGTWPKNLAPDRRRELDPQERAQLETADFRGGEIPESAQPIDDLLCRRDFAGGQMARDMSLFVDDDGSGYHLYSSEENSTLHISRLSDDFLTSSGNYVRLFAGRFHEAPALMKRNGRYFLFSSACTGWTPNPARLSTADSILGEWTELGNPCVGEEAAIATSFESQPTYLLPVAGKPGAFIYMGDRWRPAHAIDGRYIWLPVQYRVDGTPFLEWRAGWNLHELPVG